MIYPLTLSFNHFMQHTFKAGLLLCSLCVAVSTAHAAATINIVESGADVVATGSGSFLFTNSPESAVSYVPAEMASIGALTLGGGGSVANYSVGLTGPSSFGSSSFVAASSGTGDTFGVVKTSGFITVPVGYVSGTELSGTATWVNQTLSSLGLTAGTYVYSWGSDATADSLTLVIGTTSPVTSVPEPASALMCLAGLAGVAASVRRRRAA